MHGTDDEPLGGGADKVERIARDQRQRPRRRRVQHRDILRFDHPRSLDAIDALLLERVDLDRVTWDDVLQSAEEAVPVPGDARVPVRSRLCCVLDVTDPAVERPVVGARQHRHLQANLRDSEHRERRGGRLAQRLTPSVDALWGPEGLVRRDALRGNELKGREALQIVPRRGSRPDLVRAPEHKADKPECPAGSLGDPQKPAT